VQNLVKQCEYMGIPFIDQLPDRLEDYNVCTDVKRGPGVVALLLCVRLTACVLRARLAWKLGGGAADRGCHLRVQLQARVGRTTTIRRRFEGLLHPTIHLHRWSCFF
jgi:hypothetical protein